MKYFVLSDIHGGGCELEKALEIYDSLDCDALVLLGDLLNHGPRNIVPSTYDPPEVSELLNERSHEIIAVRGNCDSEVDSMMFRFPCNAPYGYLMVEHGNGIQKIMLTHGHLFNLETESGFIRSGLKAGDIVFSGHTHVSGITRYKNGIININPGSITLPRGGTEPGYGLITSKRAAIYTLNNVLVDEYFFEDSHAID